MTREEDKVSQMQAVGLMLVAMLLYSLIPVLVNWSVSFGSVAIVTGVWMLSHATTKLLSVWRIGQNCAKSILTESIRIGKPENVVRLGFRWCVMCLRVLPRYALGIYFVTSFQWVFFVWSARHIEVAVTTIIYEFWPVTFLLVRNIVLRRRPRDLNDESTEKRIATSSEVVLLFVAGVGLSMTVLSQYSTSGAESVNLNKLSIGVLLAAVALALATAGTTTGVNVGESEQTRLSLYIRDSPFVHNAPSSLLAKLSLSNVASAFPRLISAALLITFGVGEIVVGRYPLSWTAIVFGIALGFFQGISSSVFFAANHASKSDTINSLYYGVPMIALVWLWLFSEVDISNQQMFIAGVVGIVSINMILHLDPEGTGRNQQHTELTASGLGFNALLISIWISGSIVLLRDQWFSSNMLERPIPEYWAIHALCATVFVLILSFRQNRISARQGESDRLTLSVHTQIQVCYDRKLLTGEQRDDLMERLGEIDTKRKVVDIGQSYFSARHTILTSLQETIDLDDRERLRFMLSGVETLANLRQQGRNVSDLSVLALFAILSVFLALFSRPDISSIPGAWTGFINDIVAMVLASAISFLFFDLFDRAYERDRKLLRKDYEQPFQGNTRFQGWQLNLYSYTDPNSDRIISALLGITLLLVFAVLLYNK